jgi:hypothetical protein
LVHEKHENHECTGPQAEEAVKKNPRVTTEDTDDPMDGGGRAPTVGALGDAGAIAENTEILVC